MSLQTCREFESALAAAVESRSGLSGWDGHVAECAACRRAVSRREALDEAVDAWRADVPDVDLIAAVLGRRREPGAGGPSVAPLPVADRGAGSRSAQAAPPAQPVVVVAPSCNSDRVGSRPRGIAAVAVATIALLAVVVGLDGERPTAGPIARVVPPSAGDAGSPRTLPTEAAPVVLADAVRDAGRAYLALASDAAVAARDVAILIPSSPLPSLPQGSAVDAGEPPSLPDPDEGTWKPLRDDVGQALDFLWRTIPGAGPAT